jgi:beta-phosphoglucomutase-like phosphatase (HAD superfamily)
MTKLVIFDLDGVLIDSKDYHYEALNQALWGRICYRSEKIMLAFMMVFPLKQN